MLDALKNYRYLAWPFAAVALLTGIEWLTSESADAPASAADWKFSGYGPDSYEAAMARSDADISLGQERVRNGPDQWLNHESLARGYLRRSRLSFSYDELAAAGEALSEAKRLAPARAGPLLSDAVFAQMSHQLGRAETSLMAMDGWAVKSEPAVLAESASLKGDIAFYRGDLRGALAHYQEAGRYGPNVGIAYRLANLAKSRGDFDTSIRHFAETNPEPRAATPLSNATTAMRIGGVELARGDYQAAKTWFETADRLFPGYWLIEAHVAQGRALEGDLDGAIAEMRRIARRAPSAEILDALAMLLRANGQASESRIWARKAAAIWGKRLNQLPEAAYGHAVEHELVFGSPIKALNLARLNLKSRPYGEARVLLASALIANGAIDEALEQLALAEDTGWKSAPLYAVRAQASELAGMEDEASDARKKAKALNPRIFDAETSLIWLSHG
ncbi:hypothetical protein LCM19_02140 [Qipengyuania flava]|nr:hypothetical protein [Qipengyuania flava]